MIDAYYFAGAYARQAELRGYRARLQRALPAARVSARWLDEVGPAAESPDLNDDPGRWWEHARRDIVDVCASSAIVSFTGQGGRGGRHVEHGMAIMLREVTCDFRLIIVGPREVIFHTHPGTEVCADFPAFLAREVELHGGPR